MLGGSLRLTEEEFAELADVPELIVLALNPGLERPRSCKRMTCTTRARRWRATSTIICPWSARPGSGLVR